MNIPEMVAEEPWARVEPSGRRMPPCDGAGVMGMGRMGGWVMVGIGGVG